jgi:twitching motility protein PilT
MSKLDVYLRSIEKFGATGAVLTSNQPVVMRFPQGDRHATQVTPHDQLVIMIREVAPPAALDAIDRQRPAQFAIDSAGTRYLLSVTPRQGAWQVAIDLGTQVPNPLGTQVPNSAAPERAAPASAPSRSAPAAPAGELLIERGQYDAPADARPTASGSTVLDELTRAARGARASDIYLAAGAPPLARSGGELSAIGAAIDGDTLSREVGVVAPAIARGLWSEGNAATFAYSDGAGRVRVTLARDHRGPTATLRLLPEAVPFERLNLDLGDWLDRTGLIVIAGGNGAGKTVTLSALVGALAARKRHVISIEDPIEIVQQGPLVSQREVGAHAASISMAVATALRENPDALAIGDVRSAEAAHAVLDATYGAGLVIATITAPSGTLALERLVEHVGRDRQESARVLLGQTLLGTIVPVPGRSGRSFEVVRPGERRA